MPAAALVAAAITRRRMSQNVEAEYAARFTRDGEGVAEGAQSFRLEGTNGRRLLLLHGSGDTPQSLRYLGERLNAAGYTVFAPLLPGHGRSPRAFATTTADEYYEAAKRALAELHPSGNWVGLIGLSMGGAIAARLAVDTKDVRVLAMLAPYLSPPPDVQWVRATAPLWGFIAPYLRGRGEASVHDREADAKSRAYGTFSPGALTALARTANEGLRALPEVTQPTLVINSEQDNRIPRKLALGALERIRAPMEQHWVSGCGHVITVDYCKDAVADLVVAFLVRHAG
ncbi:MAG: alpha/beta fold hydrolase [bacterium]